MRRNEVFIDKKVFQNVERQVKRIKPLSQALVSIRKKRKECNDNNKKCKLGDKPKIITSEHFILELTNEEKKQIKNLIALKTKLNAAFKRTLIYIVALFLLWVEFTSLFIK